MTSQIEKKLNESGITLPKAAPPAANYDPFSIVDSTVYISGQLPMWDGELKFKGILGDSLSLEEGQTAAQLCGLNILAQLKVACEGNLDRVVKCVRLGGFVTSTPGFTKQPLVINGASDLMIQAFGDAGRHARAAVGVPSLPLGVGVEIDAIFTIK